MLHEQRETNRLLVVLTERVEKLEFQMEKIENQMMNNNLAIGELRMSLMRLADEILVVHDHERRIVELEKKAA
jgi:hypothetical protein